MKEFIEKWNTDPRFKTKVKLGLYTLFVIIVAIFAFSTRGNVSETLPNDYETENEQDNITVEIPEDSNYAINITINGEEHRYNYVKDSEKEIITKTSNGITDEYIFKDNKYFKNSVTISSIIEKEEVYDIIEYNYINIETINKYLSISNKKDDEYIVYLKDIILGHDSEEYITITIDKNKTSIDYTSLMKLFDNTIENSIVEVIIENEE